MNTVSTATRACRFAGTIIGYGSMHDMFQKQCSELVQNATYKPMDWSLSKSIWAIIVVFDHVIIQCVKTLFSGALLKSHWLINSWLHFLLFCCKNRWPLMSYLNETGTVSSMLPTRVDEHNFSRSTWPFLRIFSFVGHCFLSQELLWWLTKNVRGFTVN